MDVLAFYKYFDEVINVKNELISMNFDNKKVNSKDYVLINLLDLNSVLEAMKYQKNSIIYEYVTSTIEFLDYNFTEEVNRYLEDKYLEISKKFCFKSRIIFESDLNKIFNSGIQISPIINLEEINLKIIEMLNYLISLKQNKIFIVFYDSEFINFDSSFDNIYLFNFSQKNSFNSYNLLLINKEIKNFENQLLIDKIKLNWPISYNDFEIEELLNNLLINYFKMDNINSSSQNEIVLYTLLNKFFNLNKKIIIKNMKLNDIIKSFLKNF